MGNIIMNNNCQEYDFSVESLLLCCNKPFHFCSKDTHITFPPINFQNKGYVNTNCTYEVTGLHQSCLVSLILTRFAPSG